MTVTFWVIKILATTVGETAADLLSTRLGLGLGVTSAVMAAYDDAARKSASAMCKDDDTCHKVIGDALAAAGKTLK